MSEYNFRWTKFLILLIAINFFLILLWICHEQQKTNERLKQEIHSLDEKINENLKQVSELNEKINQLEPTKLKEEIARSTENARQDILQSEQEHANVQYYRNSLSSIGSIKVALTESYMNEGIYTLEPYIPNLEDYAKGAIKTIHVDTKIPRIHVQLQTVSGVSAGYYYVEGVSSETGMVTWKCKAFADPLLQRALPECEFIK